MNNPMFAREIKPVKHAQRCDLKAPGHNQLIPPGKKSIRTTSGECQGVWHGRRCWEVAVQQVKKLKEQHGIK